MSNLQVDAGKLEQACDMGDVPYLSALLNAGVSTETVFDDGRRPLHVAAASGRWKACELLLAHGADPNARDAQGHAPLDLVPQGDASTGLRLIGGGAVLDVEGDRARDIMIAAAREGMAVAAMLLLRRGVDPFIRDAGDVPAFHVACSRNQVNVCEVMAEHGAPVDGRDKQGYTGLHRAAMAGKADAVRWLVRAGADIEAATQNLATPLRLATMPSGEEAFLTLLELGADFTAQAQGWSCLEKAAERRMRRSVMACLALAADFDQACAGLFEGSRKPHPHIPRPESRLEAALRAGSVPLFLSSMERSDGRCRRHGSLAQEFERAMEAAKYDLEAKGVPTQQVLDVAQAWYVRETARQALGEMMNAAAPSNSNFAIKP